VIGRKKMERDNILPIRDDIGAWERKYSVYLNRIEIFIYLAINFSKSEYLVKIS
jgi:hypothetical protein